MSSPLEYSYRVIKPFALENSTPPVHQKSYVNGTRFKPSNALSGAATGGSFGGVYGAAAGAAVGLASDIWQAVYAKKRAKEANEESRRAADVASARASQEARIARAYNSEQEQIRRMRMAGLSPGLAYGQMSPSTAAAAPQEKADVHKADTPKFDNESILHALQLLINQQNANTQAAAQSSTADLQSTQAQLNRIESQFKAQEKLAGISAVLAQKDLTDEEKLSVIAKRLPEVELLQSQANSQDAAARNANANAAVTEQTGVPLANSQIAANNASAAVNAQQAAILKLTYDLDNSQWISIQKFMKDNGFDESLAPLVMKALSSIANSSGKTLESVLSSLASLPGSIVEHYLEKFMPEFEDYTITDEIESGRNRHSKHIETTKGRRHK